MIVAIDFDGTLTCGPYPQLGAPRPGAVDAMRRLHADGHYLIIWTCRCGDHLINAINWMQDRQIPFDRINAHNPDNLALYGDDTRKVYAHVYVDDGQVGGLPTWNEIYDYITEKQLQHKNKTL